MEDQKFCKRELVGYLLVLKLSANLSLILKMRMSVWTPSFTYRPLFLQSQWPWLYLIMHHWTLFSMKEVTVFKWRLLAKSSITLLINAVVSKKQSRNYQLIFYTVLSLLNANLMTSSRLICIAKIPAEGDDMSMFVLTYCLDKNKFVLTVAKIMFILTVLSC